ncbi:MAG: RluA family pseudouridine synthase [Anaeromyxobacteraceae bacterium]
MSLEVLVADEHLAAVAKPPGRIVVPGRGAPERTIREEAEAALGPLWVVHRLDRGTSGVLLLARSAAIHRALCGLFERHEVVKRYLALVRGAVTGEFRVDVPIAPGRKGRMRAGEGLPGARASSTFVRAVAAFGHAASLVEAWPASGRTHQVRVHLAHVGHPLLVDDAYGEPPPWTSPDPAVTLERTPLHAVSLEFLHPATGAPFRVEAPLPADMADAERALRTGQASKSG